MSNRKVVQEFEKGYRPDPATVFQKIVDVVNHYIDFTRSLADQSTMCELIACYILTTWFLEAFDVIGFLWANGERGSGKTNLINLVADMSYLGHVILAGGSFATLGIWLTTEQQSLATMLKILLTQGKVIQTNVPYCWQVIEKV